MRWLSCCPYCGTVREAGTGYWHLYGCRARARRVLSGTAEPLELEHVHGVLSVRVRRCP